MFLADSLVLEWCDGTGLGAPQVVKLDNAVFLSIEGSARLAEIELVGDTTSFRLY